MVESSFDLENELLSSGRYDFVIGIDEAGRGPLAGPVMACAALLKNCELRTANSRIKRLELVRDSKTLSEKQRESIFDFVQDNFFIGIGTCSHETIDQMNILEASFLAMKKAVSALLRNAELRAQSAELKMMILVDGDKKIPNFSMEQRAIAGGDRIVKSISAASIVAKVTRDRIMRKMHEKYPEYGFAKHKGYGTKFHMKALKKNGPCKIHRKTFEPMKSFSKKRKS
jgi:ribonuclease HII